VTVLKRNDSPGRQAWRRFTSHKFAVGGALVLIGFGLLSFVGPVLLQIDPRAIALDMTESAPSSLHWLGTDALGRDIFARALAGGRVSLTVGLLATGVAVAVGLALGLIAGNLGGRVDSFIMAATDVVLSFPALVVVVVLAGMVGPSLTILVLAIGAFSWPEVARVVRGETLRLREFDYVRASRASGGSRLWVATRHIWPAVMPPVIVVGTLIVARAILLEAGLSYLGLGVPPPTPSWGNMLQEAQSLRIIRTAPWIWLTPGLAITLTVLSVNLLGDGLQDATDPRGT
jgi:ABC-type dipeptide/oligopeptide/nickel transport system permease subunit